MLARRWTQLSSSVVCLDVEKVEAETLHRHAKRVDPRVVAFAERATHAGLNEAIHMSGLAAVADARARTTHKNKYRSHFLQRETPTYLARRSTFLSTSEKYQTQFSSLLSGDTSLPLEVKARISKSACQNLAVYRPRIAAWQSSRPEGRARTPNYKHARSQLGKEPTRKPGSRALIKCKLPGAVSMLNLDVAVREGNNKTDLPSAERDRNIKLT